MLGMEEMSQTDSVLSFGALQFGKRDVRACKI